MATELSKGSLFDPVLVKDLVSKVKGHSSLAVLSAQTPIPFNGRKEFTFTMDSEIDVVAENGKKSHGGITVDPVTIVPIKVEYGARISDEFLYASEEEQLDILKSFNDGFAKKLASGLDIMAFHGINPRSGEASAVIGENNFDSKVTQKVVYTAATPDANIEAAIELVEGSDKDVSGIAIAPTVRADLAKMTKQNGEKLYPEFAFGGKPTTLGAQKLDINKTVSVKDVDKAIVGDFANMFKWGYAKEIPMEIIEYGDPDNSGKDLKGYNQVYIRAEAYLGWGILDGASFARVTNE
ncbi:phage major capsid protein [Faecalicatena contorta]|uniref:phage major capsid family protein n=1 Tax=Faecalicatena contorta TaxID=39482 RepID=UPI001F416090|nr:phage major capsid protein [Faecalicatena contorta]MCF2555756.1 phage major capsid protein [Faecalicatena contorta]